jgi:site-specific recombinase XerD
MIGLIIYQALRSEELAKLELQDLQLREGKITIHSTKRAEGRILKLEAHQVYDLMDFVHVTRKEILALKSKLNATQNSKLTTANSKLFMSIGSSNNFNNLMQNLLSSIQITTKKIRDMNQIRTSVITNWLKQHNLRKVQYMAGHRYVSSTEAYQLNNIEELIENIKNYHPIG